MRLSAAPVLALSLVAAACTHGGGGQVISASGVRVVVPKGWHQVTAARDTLVTDPRTLLVVGTDGVRSKATRCTLATYGIPPGGAVVAVVGWKSVASAGGVAKPGRAPLRTLVRVHKPSFECFKGRGAAVDVLLGGKPYQVNVLVGDRAPDELVAQALAIGRSFDLTR
jgi:hypothetical protein